MAMFDPIDKIHDAHYERMKAIRQKRIEEEKMKARPYTEGEFERYNFGDRGNSKRPTHGGWPELPKS